MFRLGFSFVVGFCLAFALRAVFLSVAVWWAVFSIPLFRNVPEPPVIRRAGESGQALRATIKRLRRALSEPQAGEKRD